MSIVLCIEEDGEIRRVPLGIRAVIIGRASGCQIQLKDGKTSSKHVAFKIGKEGKAVAKDLESTNGTYINEYKVMETYIHIDDVITIGEVKMWLDPKTMTPKEKEIHTQDEKNKTSITFIKLKEYEQQKDGSEYRNIRPENDGPTTTNLSESRKIIKRDQLVEKSKEAAQENTSVGVDNVIDQDDPTGQTKMIKIEKKPKRKVVQEKAKEKEEGLADKILSFFKK